MTRRWRQAERSVLVTFGQGVAERRRALGLSQEQFGRRVDLHRTCIGAIERGTANIGVANVVRIAHALETDIGELLGGLNLERFEPD